MQTTGFDPENGTNEKITNPFADLPDIDETQKKLFVAGAVISILIAVFS